MKTLRLSLALAVGFSLVACVTNKESTTPQHRAPAQACLGISQAEERDCLPGERFQMADDQNGCQVSQCLVRSAPTVGFKAPRFDFASRCQALYERSQTLSANELQEGEKIREALEHFSTQQKEFSENTKTAQELPGCARAGSKEDLLPGLLRQQYRQMHAFASERTSPLPGAFRNWEEGRICQRTMLNDLDRSRLFVLHVLWRQQTANCRQSN